MVFTGCFGQLVAWFLVILDKLKRALIPELDKKAIYHWHLLTDHMNQKSTPVFHQQFPNGLHCAFSIIFDQPGYSTFINLWLLNFLRQLRPILIYLPNDLSSLKSGDVIHKIEKFCKWKSYAKISAQQMLLYCWCYKNFSVVKRRISFFKRQRKGSNHRDKQKKSGFFDWLLY